MAIQVYLNFNGNCREAVDFYANAFGVQKAQIMTYGDMPPNPDFPVSEEAKKLILHTYLDIYGTRVMFSDVFPGMDFVAGNNISLTIMTKSIEETRALFDKLKEGGTVDKEPQETFWSKCYGSLTDKFGIPWQISMESHESPQGV